MQTRSLVRWNVQFASGALDDWDEEEFLRALHAAVDAAIASYRAQVTLLTAEYFDLGVPSHDWGVRR